MTSSQLRTATSRVKQKLATIKTQMADASRIDVLGPLVRARDVRKAWKALNTDRQRAVIDALMTIRIMPPSRGTRTFRPEMMIIEPR